MARQIGSFTFLGWRMLPDSMGEGLEEIRRQGVDGVAFAKTGKTNEPFDLETTEIVTAATTSVQTRMRAYKALEGTVATVSDGWGSSWSLVVRKVKLTKSAAVAGPVGGTGDTVITAVWTLQDTEIP